ncbi:hypothetical protein AGIG_G5897 [Arapaima gigas]
MWGLRAEASPPCRSDEMWTGAHSLSSQCESAHAITSPTNTTTLEEKSLSLTFSHLPRSRARALVVTVWRLHDANHVTK